MMPELFEPEAEAVEHIAQHIAAGERVRAAHPLRCLFGPIAYGHPLFALETAQARGIGGQRVGGGRLAIAFAEQHGRLWQARLDRRGRGGIRAANG